MSEPLVEVRDLRKVFQVRGNDGGTDEFVAVDGVSFAIGAGESVAIVGESGSGKTTTARIVAGLVEQTSGDMLFEGHPRTSPGRGAKKRLEHARRIQMVFQDPFSSLDPRQTVGASITELLTIHFQGDASWRTTRMNELLDQVGLEPRHSARLPRELSGGQRQRVAIARALSLRPQLLILDEAVSALDVSVQAQVLNLLISLRSSLGIAYLFVSHDLAVVRQISDTCLVMSDGVIVERGPTQQILDHPEDPYTQRLLAAVPRRGWKPMRSVAAEA